MQQRPVQCFHPSQLLFRACMPETTLLPAHTVKTRGEQTFKNWNVNAAWQKEKNNLVETTRLRQGFPGMRVVCGFQVTKRCGCLFAGMFATNAANVQCWLTLSFPSFHAMLRWQFHDCTCSIPDSTAYCPQRNWNTNSFAKK